MDDETSRMPCVLLTGMSGVGKSAVVRELRGRGFEAIEMDEPGWWYRDERGDQRWEVGRLRAALEANVGQPVFVSGCSADQGLLVEQWTHRVLLSAPEAVMRERVLARTDNPYGKDTAEWAEVLANLREVEPVLRRSATLEVVTTVPVAEVVSRVLRHVG